MSVTALACDQAIFTSIRTPTGEGYRIIAASRGLRPDEKQTITRYSPSHDALCWSANDASDSAVGVWDRLSSRSSDRLESLSHRNTRATPVAAAFYPLPSGRLCVAFSCYAGAEHTGRGGQRVYTHNLVFQRHDFPLCGYNPFTLLRAMADTQLTSPQLKPPAVLPELHVPIAESASTPYIPFGKGGRHPPLVRGGWGGGVFGPNPRAALTPAWRGYVLQALLDERSLIVNLKEGWFEVTEALLMGVPGPMRTAVSFAAGLRFSVGRCHRLSLLWDDQGVTRSRVAGRSMEFVDPEATSEPPTPSFQNCDRQGAARSGSSRVGDSAWLSFVERHWESGDTTTLARRTSRDFPDVGESGRERVGRMYNQIDAIAQTDTATLLTIAAHYLNQPHKGVETDIAAEFVVAAQRALLNRLSGMSWDEVSRYWPTIVQLRRRPDEGHAFAQPLVDQAFRIATTEDPTVAAQAVLDLARER